MTSSASPSLSQNMSDPADDELSKLALVLYSAMMKNGSDKESDGDETSPTRANDQIGYEVVPAPIQRPAIPANMESPPYPTRPHFIHQATKEWMDYTPSPPPEPRSTHLVTKRVDMRPPYNSTKENYPPSHFVTNHHRSSYNINPHQEASGLDYRPALVEAPYYPPIHTGRGVLQTAPRLKERGRSRDISPSSFSPPYDNLCRENLRLREQLKEREYYVSSLQLQLYDLENQINELRQLPTGKISHIPIDDMISIMQEYGSEVSDQLTMSAPRKSIKKSSVIRQFRRWNPEFFTYFVHVNGKWVPKLGKEGELRRRNEKRTQIKNKTIKKTT